MDSLKGRCTAGVSDGFLSKSFTTQGPSEESLPGAVGKGEKPTALHQKVSILWFVCQNPCKSTRYTWMGHICK